jgi:hypothetical protein
MPWFDDFLKAISKVRSGSAHPPGRRAVAAALSTTLLIASLSPGLALASEADSESEGTAAPGVIEGGPDPEGEESVLEDVAGAVVGGGSTDTGEGPPLESESEQEAELPPVPVEAPDPEATPPESEQAPASEAPSAEVPEPEYGPTYEPASSPSMSEPVENQPLTAPESPSPAGQEHEAEGAAQTVPEDPLPSAPQEAPTGEPVPLATTAPERHSNKAAGLAGRVHVVRAGECLWSIAEALLPAGARNAEIVAEVRRLWSLNAARIGTGDPSLLYTGTALRLH